MVYVIAAIVMALFVGWDARRRKSDAWPLWAMTTLIAMPLVLPIYLAVRPLQHGEMREGGRAWNILKNYVIGWTIYIVAFVFWSRQQIAAAIDSPTAGFLTLLGFAFVWAAAVVPAMLLGFFLKKRHGVEHGLT